MAKDSNYNHVPELRSRLEAAEAQVTLLRSSKKELARLRASVADFVYAVTLAMKEEDISAGISR